MTRLIPDPAIPILRAEALGKTFASTSPGRAPVELFRDLSLTVAPGELVAVVGESGTGKSSLLHLLALLDQPTAGQVWLAGQQITKLTGTRAAQYRNRDIGYVWQFHYLLPEFTAAENVMMPLLARGMARKEALPKAVRWLDKVGLSGRADHRSGELSGGEQQRVSLARALVTEPKLLLADEPTGDLDERTAEAIFTLIRSLQQAHGLAGVLVTHHLGFAERCDRMLRLRDGRLSER